MIGPISLAFPPSMFVPLALGFFGLGTGYLIYGPQELTGRPRRDQNVDRTNGAWGIWLPGFCQFVAGVVLFIGLTWFPVFRLDRSLYMAALAFTVYGIHWFAIGWIRQRSADARPNALMSIPFLLISVLGVIVFFRIGDWPVGLLFSGLTAVYFFEFFASFKVGVHRFADGRESINMGEKLLGFAHVMTGMWLIYLTFAVTLNITSNFGLPT